MKLHRGVLKEVFLERVYEVPVKKPQIIFDLGAHVGYASIYYALRYPRADIYAFEPDPHAFKILQRNTKLFSRIHPIQKAISGHTGESILHMTDDALGSALGANGVSVATLSLNDALMQYGTPDILKFNVEGAEADIFKKFDTSRIKAYVGEYHEDLTGIPIQDFLSGFPNPTYQRIARKRPRYWCKAIRN